MEVLKWLLMNYGQYIATILLVIFLGTLPRWDTILGRIFLFVVGVAFLLTMWFGIALSL